MPDTLIRFEQIKLNCFIGLKNKIADLLRKHGGKTGEELKASTKPSASQEQ